MNPNVDSNVLLVSHRSLHMSLHTAIPSENDLAHVPHTSLLLLMAVNPRPSVVVEGFRS